MKKQFLLDLFEEHKKASGCPSPILVVDFFNDLLGFLFPEFSTEKFEEFDDFKRFYEKLNNELLNVLSTKMDDNRQSDREIADAFMAAAPSIKEKLKLDVQAMYEGDPAAKSITEVVRTYPGFYAIASYRIAHYLYRKGLWLIARIITENAHNKTGIDIHPGAKIGSDFCIDHGTGIVIGETAVIGDHVKVYQGVTIGALSVRKEDAATKRHPTIEDRVVIYAGASILGGETVVGRHSVIGGNVWLTQSVPPHSKIYYKATLVNEAEEREKSFYK